MSNEILATKPRQSQIFQIIPCECKQDRLLAITLLKNSLIYQMIIATGAKTTSEQLRILDKYEKQEKMKIMSIKSTL